MRKALFAAALFATAAMTAMPVAAEMNFGNARPNPVKPFVETPVATFNFPWAIAFLPDGHMLITEKPGKIFLVSQTGQKQEVSGVPAVQYEGQGGLLDVAISPHYAADHQVYISYSEPGEGGSSLAVARATLKGTALEGLKVIWRQMPKGDGGQFGGIITFDPAGRHILFASGERMRKTPAQDPDQALGKIIRLNLDGSVPTDNPMYAEGGVKAQTWTTGHRNPYGLAYDAKGTLWEVEMGPKGGDELNIITPGKNYGWPTVSNGINYDGSPIPPHDTRPEFEKPVVYWTPVIAPAGLAFYYKSLFPQWKGSAFIGGLKAMSLVRVAFDGPNGAREADRWDMGHRIRDVAVGPDGAVWVIEDEDAGRLIKLTPKKK
ncbi:PQQ-dependent sugar dehydrogenase [Sphingomonas oligoaromativorans]|uniref:PQQ-dependent sugar dehydrogenase n=1 Tax=Sphingomonas oligoaromativorans TaxID=575322 RepID=UPI0014227FB6|nr:PQQ-dependent sugar dehydrogenase [Sphingomonas oligoaromativorans]NIJ33169.1 glucose/arabinose dehydrogenase [Sphingomonas oligoaromativorans]